MSGNPCPDPAAWATWLETGPDPALSAHLAFCPDCRELLTILAEAEPQEVPPSVRRDWERRVPSRSRIPYALAASALLAVSILAWAWNRRNPPVQALPALPAPARTASTEWFLGGSGKVEMTPGSQGSLGDGFRLETGEAWVEAGGEAIRISLSGWDGHLELREGLVALRTGSPVRTSCLWLAEARADEGWALHVVRGEARVSDGRILKAGQALGDPFTPSDFRGWRVLKDEGTLRDSVLSLLPPGTGLPFAAEMLVRKRKAGAEAAVRFSGWEAPLGGYLPPDVWVRVRLERGVDRVRLRVGDREYFSTPLSEAGEKAYAVPSQDALALRAWGGDVEVREARWRP